MPQDYITVSFRYVPNDDERDSDHETGLTADAHDELMDQLIELGANDIEIAKVA